MLKARSKAEAAAVAIFHASTKPLGRSAGRSSVAAAAYRAGVELIDQRTGVVHDYTRRSGVVAAELITPDGAALDRSALWNAAEAAEKRRDARTAREWVLALPAELDAAQRAALVREFGWELATRYSVAVDVAIHAPGKQGDQRNHHAHMLTTTRVCLAGQLGEKASIELSDTRRRQLGMGAAADEVSAVRARWAELANAALANADQVARIDHRSLWDQQVAALDRDDLVAAFALDREPQKHAGPHATGMDRRMGEIHSERGQARERAVMERHRAAYSAERRAERAAFAEWAEAERLVVTKPIAPEIHAPEPIEPKPLQEPLAEVAQGQPIRPDESAPEPALEWTLAELRAKVRERSRTVEERLQGMPEVAEGRRQLAVLKIEARAAEAEILACQSERAQLDFEHKEWRKAHPLRAMLESVWPTAKAEERNQSRRELDDRAEAGRRAAEAARAAYAERRAGLIELIEQLYPEAVAAAEADALKLNALREDLAEAEADEQARRAAEQEKADKEAEAGAEAENAAHVAAEMVKRAREVEQAAETAAEVDLPESEDDDYHPPAPRPY